MSLKEIKKDLYRWLSTSKNDYYEEKDDINLFSPCLNLYPRDVVYLFLYIRDKYDIVISPHKINDINFFTINNISHEIFELTSKKI